MEKIHKCVSVCEPVRTSLANSQNLCNDSNKGKNKSYGKIRMTHGFQNLTSI